MADYAPQINYQYKSNVISFEDLKSKKNEENTKVADEPKRISYTAGKSTEVYAFRTEEEIKAMIDVYDKHIDEATNEDQRRAACRNKMMFVVGLNIGIRVSDLASLKYSFFFDKKPNGEYAFKKFYTLQPKKQRKSGKFVKLFFNQTVRVAIENYIAEYPFESLDEYLFTSREGDNKPLETRSIWRIIKRTAKEAGINKNIGSHSLRKTWAYRVWSGAEDKNKALVMLMRCFNHSSAVVTMRYIGIMDDEIEKMYNSVELGLDYL